MKKKSKKMQRFLGTVLSAFMIVTALPVNTVSAMELGEETVQAAYEEDVAAQLLEDEILDDSFAETEETYVDQQETVEAEGFEVTEIDTDLVEEAFDEPVLEAAHDDLIELTTASETVDGIKTTTTKWNFATAKNTGKTTAAGDTISGIIVGGGSGRVILDEKKDLNVKQNSTAETTGVIYIPIANDTNVVTIKITPMDSDKGRYVSVGSFDSEVFLIDDKGDAEHQSVTFKSDLKDFVVDKAGEVEGRFIPIYSHGNFKTAAIELVETDAVTIVDVSGKLTGNGAEKVTGLKFKNETTGVTTTCDVKDGAYSVSLPNEFKYVVSVKGTFEYGIDDTNDGNILDLSTGNDKTKEKDFALVEVATIAINGSIKINKIDNAKAVSAETLKVTLIPAKTTLDSIELTLTKGEDDYNYTYTAIILPNEEYTVELTNANDYECTAKIKEADSKKIDLEVAAKALHKVSLEAVTHNLKAVESVTALKVKNLDDSYEYSFAGLNGKTVAINLRDGLYEVTEVTTEGSFKPYEHFEIKGEDVTDKMYLEDTSEKAAVAYSEKVSVGKENSDYTTIYDALDAVKRMERTEGQRVTIVLNDAYYQEQVVVDVPNVTFTSALEAGSTISWYYGLGGDSYYSAYLNTAIDKNHLFYDEAHAVDQYESTTIGQTPGNWGSTVNLKSTATGFKAENITFENSFNFYISEVEKNDIASSGAILDRKAEGADPTLYKSKERACVMYNRGANNIEFYNCNFISSQDTIYTGDKDEYSYFYNCTIEGTTDFICGDGNALFDNCELVLYGFSDKVIPNLVIVASKGNATKGYLFNYCTIVADKSEKIQTSNSAYLGRPWGTNDEKVAFINTILESDLIQAKGWTTMNNVPSLNKGLHEYRTRLSNGTVLDLSGRVAEKIGTDKEGTADNYVLNSDEGFTRADYLSKDWTPSYFGADYSEVNDQILRYNAVVADAEAYDKVETDKKTALEDAYKAVVTGLLANDQAKVDTFANDLRTAVDAIAGEQVKAPASSAKSGTYTGSVEVTLSSETEGAKIYYTTDGSVPTAEAGTLYEGPITLKETVVLKAIAVKEGCSDSEVSVFEYVIESDEADEVDTYVFDATTLVAAADKEAIADKTAFADSYYVARGTIIKRTNSETGKVTSAEIGKAETGYFEFTVNGKADVTVVASSTGSKNNSRVALIRVTNGEKETIANEENIEIVEKTAKTTLTYKGLTEGTYRVVSPLDATYDRGARIYTIKTVQKCKKIKERKAWAEVANPVINGVAISEDGSSIEVKYTAETGFDGADAVSAVMYDAATNEKVMNASKVDSNVATFVPTKSGKFYFILSADRADEETKYSEKSESIDFILPLATPEFKNAVNLGKGKVKVNFYSVPEATAYVLTATNKTDATQEPITVTIKKDAVDNNSTEYVYTFEKTKKLTVGATYELSLYATRTRDKEEDKSAQNTYEVVVKEEEETEWVFSAFGQGVTKGSNAGFTVTGDDDNKAVTVWNTGNKGKLVPASTDGLSFYYTAVPANKNFTLTAKAKIDTWTFTNGQEGFGLMAADRVGVNGDGSVFWNNSYMASGTKVEYYYDTVNHVITNVDTYPKVTMKLGLGAQEKTGVTKSNLELLEANDTATVKSEFSSKMYPLETSCGDKGTGTYNLFGNASAAVSGTIENPITELTLRIQKNNTGYFVSYLNDKGEEIATQKFYDTKALQKLDSNFVYVGFFAARTFKATFSDIELTLIDPKKDKPAEKKPTTYVDPSYKVISAEYSNTQKYELQYTGNADGVLTIVDASGNAIVDAAKVKSGAVTKVDVRLEKGDNKFTVTFTPNKNFNPGGDPDKKLSSYETATFDHVVRYVTINDSEKVFVSPEGKANAAGTEAEPVDIYTAVKYVQPGQTISLAAGTYSLTSTVIVDRGIDGTASKPITMTCENGRAIFDFNKKCAGFILAGNYWYIKGIDCTKSGNSEKGIQVSGSHITLEDVRTYENGNTGIQVSRYLSSDKRADWPSYDLILNCTSYSNADSGYEDADGFAAKLTCGDGIVFDGCISYNNADDGWDLYAKVESGSIGQVTIQNCVAFGNGYGVDGTNEGNGNGFKMGGASMPGPHKLINSVAWGNKAKGIDSNSGPDIQIYNSMSFNNGGSNVALYTNDAANTNYVVDGVLSYRTEGKDTNENFKFKGTQDETRVYGKTNFFWTAGQSANSEGLKVSDNWFESLAAPKANASNPYKVAEDMRTADGRINLGSFLKLTDKAKEALTEAAIDSKDVVASLDGSYEAKASEKDIDGSETNADQALAFEVVGLQTKVVYTGSKITQDFDVYYGDEILREGVDYKVSYKNNVNVGMATITITGKGNYEGKTTETFTIVAADVNDAAVAVKAVNETGTSKNPAVKATVTYMGKALKLKKDYTIAADFTAEAQTETRDGVEVKLYPVTVTGVGNFTGVNATAKIAVYPKGKKAVTGDVLVSLKKGSIELSATSFEFTGAKAMPEVTVYAGKGANKGEKIDASKYTVKYTSNVNKGTAKVTVTGIETQGYTGTLTASFKISAVDMSKALEAKTLTVDMATSVKYVKGGAKPVPTVKLGDYTLREGVDYKVTYTGNTKVGTDAKVVIKGLKNFTKSVTKTFEVTTKDINETSVFVTDKAVKNNAKGTYLISKPVIYDQDGKVLREKTDYTVKYFYGKDEITKTTTLTEDNAVINVVITGAKAYTGETTATYQIRALKKLSSVKNEKIADQRYTGKAIRPDGQLKLYVVEGTGKTANKVYLTQGVDFDVVLCFNNTRQGTATYILKGTGNYSGYKLVSFKIKKAKVN